MYVEGRPVALYFDGDAAACSRWLPFARGKLQALLRTAGGLCRKRNYVVEDATILVASTPKLAKIYIAAGVLHGFAFIPEWNYHIYGQPFSDETGEINPPYGTDRGIPAQYDVPGASGSAVMLSVTQGNPVVRRYPKYKGVFGLKTFPGTPSDIEYGNHAVFDGTAVYSIKHNFGGDLPAGRLWTSGSSGSMYNIEPYATSFRRMDTLMFGAPYPIGYPTHLYPEATSCGFMARSSSTIYANGKALSSSNTTPVAGLGISEFTTGKYLLIATDYATGVSGEEKGFYRAKMHQNTLEFEEFGYINLDSLTNLGTYPPEYPYTWRSLVPSHEKIAFSPDGTKCAGIVFTNGGNYFGTWVNSTLVQGDVTESGVVSAGLTTLVGLEPVLIEDVSISYSGESYLAVNYGPSNELRVLQDAQSVVYALIPGSGGTASEAACSYSMSLAGSVIFSHSSVVTFDVGTPVYDHGLLNNCAELIFADLRFNIVVYRVTYVTGRAHLVSPGTLEQSVLLYRDGVTTEILSGTLVGGATQPGYLGTYGASNLWPIEYKGTSDRLAGGYNFGACNKNGDLLLSIRLYIGGVMTELHKIFPAPTDATPNPAPVDVAELLAMEPGKLGLLFTGVL